MQRQVFHKLPQATCHFSDELIDIIGLSDDWETYYIRYPDGQIQKAHESTFYRIENNDDA